MDALVDKIRGGDRQSLAKAMSLVDDVGFAAETLKDWLRRSTGQVPWWGFTGPPGVGKSTLIDALLHRLRSDGRRIGVVAVDPTSPMSDGALLGDRVRMMQHATDPDVFIRSLATHHCEGGLSDAALHCARLLELARYDPVLIETVGVGQCEVDVSSVADICVVILGPGYGDDIQLIKAGLLEIADLIVVNKCDLPEANRLLTEVHAALALSSSAAGARDGSRPGKSAPNPSRDNDGCVEVVGLEAKSGRGMDRLLDKLLELDRAARDAEQRERCKRRRLLGEIRRTAMLRYERALERGLAGPAIEELIGKLERGELSLQSVVAKLGPDALADCHRDDTDSVDGPTA